MNRARIRLHEVDSAVPRRVGHTTEAAASHGDRYGIGSDRFSPTNRATIASSCSRLNGLRKKTA